MTGAAQNPLKVLILGANGQLARNTTRVLLEQSDAKLTLYLRRANRLQNADPSRATIGEGDVLDAAALRKAMQGQDVVYANLAGDMAPQATPGESYRSILDPYRDSATRIEESDLDYTILRPGWFDRSPAVDYQLTRKGEPFKGHDVSLNSLSDLVVKLVTTPVLHVRESLGVSRV